MRGESVTNVVIALPVDDGSIARAFADLTEKMSRLISALSHGGTVRARPQSRGPAHAESDAPARAVPATSTAGAAAPSAAAPSAIAADASLRCSSTAVETEPAGAMQAHSAAVEPAPAPVEQLNAAAADAPQWSAADLDEAAATEDDEALLASLDPATADAIRVQRRLTGGRKHVRELLEEHRARQQAPPQAPRRRSWWKGNR